MTTPQTPVSSSPTIPTAEPAKEKVVAAAKPSTFEEMLKHANIKQVLVIDDVFDVPTIAELTQKIVDGFAQDLAENKAYHEEAKSLGLNAASGKLIDDNLQCLWNHCLSKRKSAQVSWVDGYEFETPLTTFMARHEAFQDRFRRHSVVYLLCCGLEKREVKVIALGATAAIPKENFDLIFLDFVLSPRALVIEQMAIDKLREFLGSKLPPYVILISDYDKVTSEKRAKICREVGALGGFFGFINKTDVSDETMLFLKLAELSVGTGVNGHQEIRAFANSVAGSMKGVADKLTDFIYRLELQDYVHLQAMRLGQAGEPLGEYIQWLFEAKLGHLFAVDTTVAETRSKVDQLTYTNLLPASSEPSDALSGAFFCAQTEPAATLANRPPQLGDTYTCGKKVRLIISPACDLFISMDGTSRRPADDFPVFILEGVADDMHPHSEKVIPNVTECFVIDGKVHRITWNVDSGVRSIDYGKLAETLKTDGFVFRAQLRPVFAIAIQRQFANNLCRVGLPIAPPIGSVGQVHLYVGAQTDKLTLLGDPIKSAAHIRQESKTLTRLTVTGISEIRSILRKAVDNPTDSVKQWITDHGSHIDAVLKKEKLWLKLASEFSPGTSGKIEHNSPDVIVGHPQELSKVQKTEGAFVIAITRESDIEQPSKAAGANALA